MRFKHDCSGCKFLGVFNEFDLYFCGGGDQFGATVLARYGDDAPSYASMLCCLMERATSPALDGTWMRAAFVAYRLAIALGLYVEQPKITQRSPHTFNVLTVEGLLALTTLKHYLAAHLVRERIAPSDDIAATIIEEVADECVQEALSAISRVLERETWEFTEAEERAADDLAVRDGRQSLVRTLRGIRDIVDDDGGYDCTEDKLVAIDETCSAAIEVFERKDREHA